MGANISPDGPRLRGAERFAWIAVCVPPLAVLGFAFVYPLAASVGSSFAHEGAVSLANYERV